jgi:hypothetical protein
MVMMMEGLYRKEGRQEDSRKEGRKIRKEGSMAVTVTPHTTVR